jgi:ribulose-phosphate 3-epimerase
LRQTTEDDNFTIEVDGGINDQTIQQCAEAGADIFVAGSYLFEGEGESEFSDKIQKLKNLAED